LIVRGHTFIQIGKRGGTGRRVRGGKEGVGVQRSQDFGRRDRGKMIGVVE